MAKIDIVRLPQPQKDYSLQQQNQTVGAIESIVFQLNKDSFFEELKNNIERREWFLS
jgi:hypothetical protein